MSNDDVVCAEDLEVVRAKVVRTRRKVMIAAVVTPLAAAPFAGFFVYYLMFQDLAVSGLVAGVFVLLGVPVLIHWWRHYRSIFLQLDLLDQRVRSGETVYGSQVAFHSYG
jgi:hypothetical protein